MTTTIPLHTLIQIYDLDTETGDRLPITRCALGEFLRDIGGELPVRHMLADLQKKGRHAIDLGAGGLTLIEIVTEEVQS